MNIRFKRLLAAIIDYYISCFISILLIGILTLGEFSVTTFTITLYILVLFLLVFFKDFIFKNASIGKKIFRIEIVKADKTKFKFIDVLKRTLPAIILLPIEIILLLVNNERVGDIWAKTIVKEKTGDGSLY